MLDTRHQPGLESLLKRMAEELGVKAALLLHETGQVLEFAGEMEERQYPSVAALISAMIATGKSLGQMGDHFTTPPTRFSCDSESMGLYTCAVTEDTWLAALYDQPLNPALHRMKIRKYAQACARLQAKAADTPAFHAGAAKGIANTGANSTPLANLAQGNQAKTTIPDPSLFSNISDDEIDRLFDEAAAEP